MSVLLQQRSDIPTVFNFSYISLLDLIFFYPSSSFTLFHTFSFCKFQNTRQSSNWNKSISFLFGKCYNCWWNYYVVGYYKMRLIVSSDSYQLVILRSSEVVLAHPFQVYPVQLNQPLEQICYRVFPQENMWLRVLETSLDISRL